VVVRRSYLVCSVQRAGSWLLCHALEDTAVLGIPSEYFHRGDEQFWRSQWGAASEDAFLLAVQREPVTPNGVWGAKMMWNYLADAVARLRAWPRLDVAADAADSEVLAAAFPGLRYVWLRRQDKLRQAISWWRAAETGQYALAPGQVAAEPRISIVMRSAACSGTRRRARLAGGTGSPPIPSGPWRSCMRT
jgi:LPS sulfotransferase NodH